MIRKTVVSITAICFLSFTAFGQAQVSLGVKGGPNFASINKDASAGENFKNRSGIHAGAFGLIKVSKVGIQPEILFSQQGSLRETPSGDELKKTLNYVNVPVMLKLYLAAGLNLQAGPQFGFVTTAKDEIIDQANNISSVDIKDQVNNTDIGVSFGVGWDLPFGLTLDGRYNLGLSNINDANGGSDYSNRVFQISIGYKFIKLGK